MMRLILLTALTMVAFAANSILNRLALAEGQIDAIGFVLIRVAAGAAVLAVLSLTTGRGLPLLRPARLVGALALTTYLYGFSIAYLRLDAGLGALILFGLTQIVMFSGAVIARETIGWARAAGAMVAFGGLIWLLWPAGALQVPVLGAIFMVLAGIGWGFYSLSGRNAEDPLAATAANFVLALPLCFALPLFLPVQMDPTPMTWNGILLATLSGAVTSGLGYALWYSVLPRLGASVGGLVQLSVPVIAILGGVAVLGEMVSLRLIGAAALVLGGIGFGLLWRPRADRKS